MSSQRKLARSRTDRKIAGVAGGMAEYFGIDSTIVRILWVLVALPGGLSIIFYFILWALLPEGDALPDAVAIAEERYARGEITADELAQIRQDLRS